MKKFLLIFISLSFFFISGLYAQNSADINITSEEISIEILDIAETPALEKKSLKLDFVMQFEPAFYLNTESKLISAPSPIVYPVSVGIIWPGNEKFSIQPVISFFMMNHLFYDGKALPAEIENRTTTTLAFMLNIPAVFSIFLPNSRFQISGGLGIFMRFGILAAGVKESDSGWTGSAGNDVKEINKWFWGKARWLYITAGGSWLYDLTPQLRAGPVINISIPVGGLLFDHNAQGMLISFGIKICR